MRKSERRIVTLVMLLIAGLPANDAVAQQIGVSLGYETGLWGMPFGGDAEWPTSYGTMLWEWDTASYTRVSVAAGVEWFAPDLVADDIGLEAGVSFIRSSGRTIRRKYDGWSSGGGNAGFIDQLRVEYITTSLRLDLLARYEAFRLLSLDGGVWGEYRTGGTFDLRYESELISRPEIIDDHAMETGPFSYGVLAGLSCDLPLSARFIIHSSVRLRADLDALGEEISWHSLGAGGMLGVRYALTPLPDE